MAGMLLGAPSGTAADSSPDAALKMNVSMGQVVQQWSFGRADDRDFDRWPDRWQRRSGREYPSYVAIEIQSETTELEKLARQADAGILPAWVKARLQLARLPSCMLGIPSSWTRLAQAAAGTVPSLPPSLADRVSGDFLQVRLDGGGAMLQSPTFPVSVMYSYVLSARIRAQGLEHDRCWAEIAFLDAQGQVMRTVETTDVETDTSWLQVHSAPIVPPQNCSQAAIRLHVEPRGEAADIRAVADFDAVQLRQFPQLSVKGSAALGIYHQDETIDVTATAMGLRFATAAIQFSLLDAYGQTLHEQRVAVDTRGSDASQLAFGGTASWQLPQLEAGFYRLNAQLIAADRSAMRTATTFAVINDLPSSGGPFGWTLPQGAPRGDLRALPEWLRDCHVSWLKFPCWIEADNLEAADELSWMMNRVLESEIQVVGLLSQPPAGSSPEIDERKPMQAAHVFRDIEVWQPLLEPLMSRLTMKVRWWQLGHDRDFSFLARSSLQESVDDINRGLRGYGEPLNLVISWPWLEPQPEPAEQSWQAVNLSESQAFTADELDAYLTAAAAHPSASSAARPWLLLDPLPKSQFDTAARIRDLVLRMATVRGHDVEAVFISDPLDPETGLLRPDGTPDVMLLPWRTTATMIGSLRRSGSLRLPNGSSNRVLTDGQRTVMVVWNPQPTTEEIYLGENVEVVNVWGQRRAADTVGEGDSIRQVIQTGPIPKFITGLNPLMTDFRMAVQLDRESIDSLLGRSQIVAVEMTNPLGQSLSGEMLMSASDAWELPRYPAQWQVGGLGKFTQEVPITLRSNAKTGVQEVALRFKLEQAGTQHFMVYRPLRVGPDGLEVEITTRLDKTGNLIVRLEMENSSTTAQQYDCRLFPPGRQYQRQTLNVGAGQRVRREFVLENGRQLVGKTLLLRAAEQDGQRVLNYTVQASQ